MVQIKHTDVEVCISGGLVPIHHQGVGERTFANTGGTGGEVWFRIRAQWSTVVVPLFSRELGHDWEVLREVDFKRRWLFWISVFI